jgi:hypothetical protein
MGKNAQNLHRSIFSSYKFKNCILAILVYLLGCFFSLNGCDQFKNIFYKKAI